MSKRNMFEVVKNRFEVISISFHHSRVLITKKSFHLHKLYLCTSKKIVLSVSVLSIVNEC